MDSWTVHKCNVHYWIGQQLWLKQKKKGGGNTDLKHRLGSKPTLRYGLDLRFLCCVFTFFFFLNNRFCWLFNVNNALVYCSRTYKFHFLATFSLKICLTVLFTHLKIILLQCFQFSVFNFSKISSIQTDPNYWNLQLLAKD